MSALPPTHTQTAQRTLFVMCAGNELFFLSLYLMKWVKTPIGLTHPLVTSLTWPEAIALLSFWVFLAKNIINFVQLWKASKILVGVDLAERAKAREESPKLKAT
jgi:CDP-diacylglycerol--inositol 3-phosphatidyltransferase